MGFFRLVFFFVLTSLTTFVLLTPSAYSDNIFIDPMPGEFGHFGRSVVTGDFNGDQVTDLIVGANERLLCGKIVFFEGPDFERNITYHDPRSPCSQGFTSHFGRTLASGDVNQDGFDDVVISAAGVDSGFRDISAVFVLQGTNFGLSSDIITLETYDNFEPKLFGSDVDVGDINGDGFDDVVVGAPWTNYEDVDYGGAVYVFFGPKLMTHETLRGIDYTGNERTLFGQTVTVGDIDGDEFDDVVVGVTQGRPNNAGKAFIFLGSQISSNQTTSIVPSALTLVPPEEERTGAMLGLALTSGDFDGDGFDDVVVGANGEMAKGTVYVFLASDLNSELSSIEDNFEENRIFEMSPIILTEPRQEEHSSFGHVLETGNIDGDQCEEIIVGAYNAEVVVIRSGFIQTSAERIPEAGEAYVFPGLKCNPDPSPTEGAIPLDDPEPERQAHFGFAISSGDTDNDGLDEVVVSAWNATVNSLSRSGELFIVEPDMDLFEMNYVPESDDTLVEPIDVPSTSSPDDVDNDEHGDLDIDGIANNVDLQPRVFSNEFSDVSQGGNTYGTIITRGEQIISINELSGSAGVKVSTSQRSGTLPALIEACEGLTVSSLDAGDAEEVTCGSITSNVLSGTIDMKFIGEGSHTIVTTITEGNSISFYPETTKFSAPQTNQDALILSYDHNTKYQIKPGMTLSLNINDNTTHPVIENVLPPLQQIKKGISPENIICSKEHSLIFKYNKSPVCVTPETAEELKQRGWTYN